MRIFVLGTRGIPDIPGGVEKHCQELYPRIVDLGHEVLLCTRAPYVKVPLRIFKGVRLIHVDAPRNKSLEAIGHTFACLRLAPRYRPDILHIHAVGPSLLIPLARWMGFRVVMTHHGPDYARLKWGRIAKWALKAGEYIGGRLAHEVISISRVIQNLIAEKCKRSSQLVYNGVPIPEKCLTTEHLDHIGVSPGKYVLTVARFVPEKGIHDLLDAFRSIDGDFNLVIAGDADHKTPYSKKLKISAGSDNRIVLTGYVTGVRLQQLFTHAALFVLPSYHEGLPIALLEAMSYGLPSLISDIPANLEVGLDPTFYFPCGDVDALKNKLNTLLKHPPCQTDKEILRRMVARKYDWMRIAEQTVAVYKQASNPMRHRDNQ